MIYLEKTGKLSTGFLINFRRHTTKVHSQKIYKQRTLPTLNPNLLLRQEDA